MPTIPTFVISMRDCAERRRLMTERLGAAGIPFAFFDAIDGRTGHLGDHFDGARIERKGFMSETAVACTLSHRSVHRMMLDQGIAQALVFEDDAVLETDFVETVQAVAEFDCDFLKLSGGVGGQQVRPGAVMGERGRYRIVARRRSSNCAAAYLIRRTGAEKLCSLPVIDRAIDEIIGDHRAGLRLYEMAPFPARQDSRIPTTQIIPPGCDWSQKPKGIAKLRLSLSRRSNAIRAYGLWTALRIEMADRRG